VVADNLLFAPVIALLYAAAFREKGELNQKVRPDACEISLRRAKWLRAVDGYRTLAMSTLPPTGLEAGPPRPGLRCSARAGALRYTRTALYGDLTCSRAGVSC
jgi:hypothetical protein